MKKCIILCGVIIFALSTTITAEQLSDERQQALLDRVINLHDESVILPHKDAADDFVNQKCGTDITFEYFIYRDQLSDEYAGKISKILTRPTTLAESYDTPGGHFKIHYNTAGTSQVYMVATDDNSNGIPDYVDEIAKAVDSSWNFEVNILGYPAPPSDGTEGGDDKVDVYIMALNPSYYGYTEPETEITSQSATSFIVIDNDYNIWPYNTSDEMESRLQAARVTIAHEFFHTIHFGMDWTEYEDQSGFFSRPWWEMTAVWMEDIVFDDVNDYILYQDNFFDYPWVGLRTVAGQPQHQYALAIFPMFLAERFDTAIVKDVWERCRDYGTGPQLLRALDDAIMAYTGYRDTTSDTSQYIVDSLVVTPFNLRSAYTEFALWNYFTGSRAGEAPPGFSYEEAAAMEMFDDTVLLTLNQYVNQNLTCPRQDTLVNGTPITYHALHEPQNLGTEYLLLNNISLSNLDSVILFNANQRWGYGFIGLPLSAQNDPLTYNYHVDTTLTLTHHVFENTDEYARYILAMSPIGIDDNLSYLLDYCTVVIFEGGDPDTINATYAIKAPYPNPKVGTSANDNITFSANLNIPSPGKRAQLKVTLFTPAGEKISEMESPEGNYYLDSSPIIEWSLQNNEGEDIAPGVYLAFCELIFNDGTESITDKYKIAIIK